MNPFKAIWHGAKFAYRQAKRPEILGILTVAGAVIPGVNLAVAAKFIGLARTAEAMFPKKGSGPDKLAWVLDQSNRLGGNLDALGIDAGDKLKYLEAAVKVMKGQARLVTDDGNELLEEDLKRLEEMFDGGF